MRYLNFILPAVFLLAACSPQIPPNSGVEGQVTIGPICPVVRPGQDCADQSYQATLAILTSAGRQLKKFSTDANGQFRLPLAPGAYILHPLPPKNSLMPFGRDEPFNVAAGQFTELKVSYDSGIR